MSFPGDRFLGCVPRDFRPHIVNLRVDPISICPRFLSAQVTVHVPAPPRFFSRNEGLNSPLLGALQADCQPPTRIASAEESLHTQDHHLTRAAYIQWTVDVVIMKALLFCSRGIVWSIIQLQSSPYVDWGFHWERIVVQLLSLPNPASSLPFHRFWYPKHVLINFRLVHLHWVSPLDSSSCMMFNYNIP